MQAWMLHYEQQKKHVFISTLMDLFWFSFSFLGNGATVMQDIQLVSFSWTVIVHFLLYGVDATRCQTGSRFRSGCVAGKVTNVLICECKHHQDDKVGDNLVEGHNNFLCWGNRSRPRDDWQCDKFWLIGTTMRQVSNQGGGFLRTSFFPKTFIFDFH